MRNLIETFPEQLHKAVEIGQNSSLPKSHSQISNVVIAGLGGSGIGGKIVAQLIQDQCNVPILTNNDYDLPAFVHSNTLVLISSYSGNTEETVSAMEQAIEKRAQIACVSSGGKVLELAQKHSFPCIVIPGGNPPRSQFGYSVIEQLYLLNHFGLVKDSLIQELADIPDFLTAHQPGIIQLAGELCDTLKGKTPVIYAESRMEGLAIRWRQQINENAKRLCWHHVFPELNHNELVGWEGADDSIAVIILQTPDDNPRTLKRMEITSGLFAKKTRTIEEVMALGETRLQHLFYLVHLGDWLSLLMAESAHVNPVSIDSIDFLKNELSKIQ